MFLKSLLPDLKSLPRAQKIRTKIQLQEVLYNAITAVEPTVFTHTFTTPEPSTQSSLSAEENTHWQPWHPPELDQQFENSQWEQYQEGDNVYDSNQK